MVDLTNNPRMLILKYMYNRPTVGQAFAECTKDYQRYLDARGDPMPTAVHVAASALREYEKEKADEEST